MAMAVQQRLFRQRREAGRETARVELAGDEFLEQKRMACEDFAARKHGAELVAEAEQACGLEPDDRRAAVDPGFERLQRATRLCLGLLDQPGREERPPAAQGTAGRQGLRRVHAIPGRLQHSNRGAPLVPLEPAAERVDQECSLAASPPLWTVRIGALVPAAM